MFDLVRSSLPNKLLVLPLHKMRAVIITVYFLSCSSKLGGKDGIFQDLSERTQGNSAVKRSMRNAFSLDQKREEDA